MATTWITVSLVIYNRYNATELEVSICFCVIVGEVLDSESAIKLDGK